MKIVLPKSLFYLRYSGILLFALSIPLPIPRQINSFAFILMLVNVILLNGNKKSFGNILKDKVLLLFLFFFLIDGIRSLLFQEVLFKEAKLAFALVPFLFLLKRDSLVKVRNEIFISFIIGITVYIVYAWLYAAYFYTIKYPNYELSLLDGYLVYLFDFHLPGALHHNYVGMYIAFAVAVIYIQTILFRTISLKVGVPLTVFFCFNLFFIGSKTTSLSLMFLLALLTVAAFSKKHYNRTFYKEFGILVSLILIGVTLMWNWLPYSIYSSIEKRIGIYTCALKVASQNIWFGVGFENIETSSVLCQGFDQVLVTHNVFLHELVSNGLLGAILVILLFGYLFKVAWNNNPALLSLTFLSFSIGLIEDVLTRQRGALFFVFFAMLFYIKDLDSGEHPGNAGPRKHKGKAEDE